MAEGITRLGLENTIKQIQEASATEDAETKALQNKAIKLFSDFTSGASDIGTMVGGFKRS